MVASASSPSIVHRRSQRTGMPTLGREYRRADPIIRVVDSARAIRRRALVLGIVAFAVYNANGREIGTYDSQPTNYTAREIVLHHTLVLDAVIGATPELASRPGVIRTADGHYRSAYSVVPAILAAGPAWVLARLHVLDLRAPVTPSLIAKLTASLLTSGAVVLAFLIARRRAGDRLAVFVALGFGLGTNLWALASQTLWQHETTIFALSAAVLCLDHRGAAVTARRLTLAAVWLGIACAARPEVAPAIAVVSLSIVLRTGVLRGVLALVPLAALTAATMAFNVAHFGHVLGAMPILEALHPTIHGVGGSLGSEPWIGALGLLVSPSRGLLIFSPIVLVAALGLRRALRHGPRGDLWWAGAALAQFALYAAYAVWWGGHTYGPRYCLDLLPFLLPLASAGVTDLAGHRLTRWAGSAALAWSLVVAGTGAFCYPAEAWNTDPDEVDTHHARLWDWRDSQVIRCWRHGPSPQNAALFSPASWRQPTAGPPRAP